LASNSLLEAVVYAHQAYLNCEQEKDRIAKTGFHDSPEWSTGKARMINEKVLVSHNWDQIRQVLPEDIQLVTLPGVDLEEVMEAGA